MEKGRTAILFFAFRPEKEALRKPLLPEFGHEVNARVYRLMQSRVSDLMAPTGLPVFHVDDTEQKGDDFGQRITHALESVFNKGFKNVIILGNDAYGLKTSHVIDAVEKVKTGHSCLLPSQLGGALLIGLSKSQYNKAHWLELPWCTSSLFEELFDCLSSCEIIAEAMPELNSRADIHEILCSKGDLTELAQYLLTVLSSSLSVPTHRVHLADDFIVGSVRFRGPPFMA